MLKTLKEILGKYNVLPQEQRSVTKLCKKVEFGNTKMLDRTTLRLELLTHVNSITLFLNLLALGPQIGGLEMYVESSHAIVGGSTIYQMANGKTSFEIKVL